ncbi:MAG TPA: hypothetical protein VM076_18085 [Gemmatimonadaceae bacterium]|nr:hypothetical protein [Gemmatimonadaceae bacterium]
MRTRKPAVFAVGALALVAACSDPAGPEPAAYRYRRPPITQERLLRGLDRELAQLAREVPGFGGLSRRPDGSALMLLTDPAQATAAKRAVAARARVLRGIDASRIDVRTVKFDYLRLTDWKARLRSSLDVPGLVFLDIDEAGNHVRVGVAEGTSHDLVVSEVAKLDIPADAVTVEDASPIRHLATLRDRVRPTLGGLQIAFVGVHTPPGFISLCTLGFNARFAGASETYLVTNSHCSNVQGGVQDAQIFQPVTGPNNLIAIEAADPELFTEGCPPERRCRFSDASLARYVDGVEATVGAIARTTLRGLTSGPLTINDFHPNFTIVEKRPFSLMGQTLDKVGRTTGWTVGTVWATCVDSFVADTDITLFCQDFVLSGSGGGDSGSPVFESQSPFTSDVALYGILWGGGNSAFGPYFVFSPMENVEFELGEMIVTAP